MKALDPIRAGEELADFQKLQEERCRESLQILGVLAEDGSVEDTAGYEFFRLMWERNFWRNKALGVKF